MPFADADEGDAIKPKELPMCGVVGLTYGEHTDQLGTEASRLLIHLEYRGYDSTGLACIDEKDKVTLRKDVGAPTAVVRRLDLSSLTGQKAIGQVRWATYGSVTPTNAQPHVMSCLTPLTGAHNGNISNTDQLKAFLLRQGHRVLSDNDGEMLMHLIEHHLAPLLPPGGATPQDLPQVIQAIRAAHAGVEGSYAACLAVPGIPGLFAIKAGSSLYAGKGEDPQGPFIMISSDMTSVLSKTRWLIPLREGQILHFDQAHYRVFSLTRQEEIFTQTAFCRLNPADVRLTPPHRFFMEQEIAQTPESLQHLLTILETPVEGSNTNPLQAEVDDLLNQLRKAPDPTTTRDCWLRGKAGIRPASTPIAPPPSWRSDDGALLQDLEKQVPGDSALLHQVDTLLFEGKCRDIQQRREDLLNAMRRARQVFLVGAGTSYHAALVAGSFLDQMAARSSQACTPGFFRSNCMNSLSPDDLVIGITQSGETKDLVDIFTDLKKRWGSAITLAALVNNENATIPQELCTFYLPLLCGPEIAVPATKSFTHQVALLHHLALKLATDASAAAPTSRVPDLLRGALRETPQALEEWSQELALRPSLHILGLSSLGLAREGALKIREVVLNHTEGIDGVEFKHGPNTILGPNTLFSTPQMALLARQVNTFWSKVQESSLPPGPEEMQRLIDDPLAPDSSLSPAMRLYRDTVRSQDWFTNYPLIFLCPPRERDIRLAITQIHTHKIRGADIYLLAEEHPDLRAAVEGAPANVPHYRGRMIALPASGDPHLFAFSATLALQRLALSMSCLKMDTLNHLGIQGHGVHPDVPKNVSKSITVD